MDSEDNSHLMPAAFLGHGSPMNAVENNRYTGAWRDFGASVPRPRAILVVSAHWYVNLSAVTAMSKPKTIHDFYGFPESLFSVNYPAPGDRAVAEEVAETVKPTWIGFDHDSWGLDHGTWSVLVHAFPDADIPVVQLSINSQSSLEDHFELGAQLARLRKRGILIVGSGNVVHNLRGVDWGLPHGGFDWAHRFNEAALSYMTASPEDVLTLASHADFRTAVPTPDHFIPLLYIAGLASAEGSKAGVLIDGYAYGSLSMTSYTLGASPSALRPAGDAGEIPDPDLVPPEDTNV